jgi:hypothetical protein
MSDLEMPLSIINRLLRDGLPSDQGNFIIGKDTKKAFQ